MGATTFAVSPDVELGKARPTIDHASQIAEAMGGPVEAMWKPDRRLVGFEEEHTLVQAVHDAFFQHYPLVLSPDTIWLTLAHGFALHVNQHADELRHRFVRHQEKQKIEVSRPDFFPGAENPWPEAFEAFSEQVAEQVGKLASFVQSDFSTTGPVERAVSHILVMDTFQAYFEYEMSCGCGIPKITLEGTVDDWKSIRDRAGMFGEFGLEDWSRVLDPILQQFVAAAEGQPQQEFWQSMFRYQSSSFGSSLTGWITALFPYVGRRELIQNEWLDWERRFAESSQEVMMSGLSLGSAPPCLASAPVKLSWGNRVSQVRFVGGLMAVSQDDDLALRPECGWAIVYDNA